MKKHSYKDYLRKVLLFADLDDAELQIIEQVSTDIDLPAGRALMTEGVIAHEMFVILSGEVEVVQDGQPVAQLGPGDFVGEMALLSRNRRNSTVIATTDVELLHIDGRSFTSMLDRAPHLAVKMLPIVASRVIAHNDHHSH